MENFIFCAVFSQSVSFGSSPKCVSSAVLILRFDDHTEFIFIEKVKNKYFSKQEARDLRECRDNFLDGL